MLNKIAKMLNTQRLFVLIVLIIHSSLFSYSDEVNIQTVQMVYADTATATVFEKGKDELFQYQLKQAEELFSLCVKREPKNADYLCWLAQTKGFIIDDLHRQGKSALSLWDDGDEIFDLYKKALEIDPKTEVARLGQALRMRLTPWLLGGSDDKAEEMYKQICQDYPDSIFPVHELGILYIKEKDDPKKALEYFLKVEEMVSNREMTESEAFWIPRTYHQIGFIYLKHMKQPEKAVGYLEKACAENHNYVEFGIDLAEAYQKTGEHVKAVAALEKAATLYEQLHHKKFKSDIIEIAKELKLPKEWRKQYNL